MRRKITRRQALGGVAGVAMGALWGAMRSPAAFAAPGSTGSSECTERHLGYQGDEFGEPYAKYMARSTRPAPPDIQSAYHGPPTPADQIAPLEELAVDLSPQGYSENEIGYGRRADGIVWAATRVEMPGVSAAMWDWWFGWHSIESARYKLWHPDAHLHAGLKRDLTTENIPDRAKYVGNTTYIDEYIGPKLQQLAINFRDPVQHGLTVPAGHTIILGRVGSSVAPVDLGWLAHQVRPISVGVEMRSRFYLNIRGLHVPDAAQSLCAIARGASADPRDLVLGIDTARDLMMHCGQEMNHLASFLPQLRAEFAIR